MERGDAARESSTTNQEVQFGMLVGFVVERSTGLPEGGPRRRFKGRVAFRGKNADKQNWGNAVFVGLGWSHHVRLSGKTFEVI